MSRPELVHDALRQWLDGPSGLDEAIRRTVEDGLFPKEDVLFAVDHLRESLTIGVLERWWKRAGYDQDFSPETDSDSDSDFYSKSNSNSNSNSDSDPGPGHQPDFSPDSNHESILESKTDTYTEPGRSPLKILCLHAGNLPLVGLQDVVAVLLSGNRYYGKLSRKDPWLIASLVEVCKERGLPEVGGCSSELGSFSGLQADAVLFTGSDKSVPGVMDELLSLKAVREQPPARYLVRTAQLSVACIQKKQSAGELIEAITRYDGRGCRSVGVVVSPFSLDEYAGALRLAEAGGDENDRDRESEAGGEENGNIPLPEAGGVEFGRVPVPETGQPSKKMTGPNKYLHAYAVAVGLPCLQLFGGRLLIIESDDTGLMRDGVVLWIKGGYEELDDVRKRLSGRIQSVFSDENVFDYDAGVVDDDRMADHSGMARDAKRAGRGDFESLNTAQRPEFDWCPDGVDTLKWLRGGWRRQEKPGRNNAC